MAVSSITSVGLPLLQAMDLRIRIAGRKDDQPLISAEAEFQRDQLPGMTVFTVGELSTGWKKPVKLKPVGAVKVAVTDLGEVRFRFCGLVVPVKSPLKPVNVSRGWQ